MPDTPTNQNISQIPLYAHANELNPKSQSGKSKKMSFQDLTITIDNLQIKVKDNDKTKKNLKSLFNTTTNPSKGGNKIRKNKTLRKKNKKTKKSKSKSKTQRQRRNSNHKTLKRTQK